MQTHQARLGTQEAKLLALDPQFKIELESLAGACGSSGEAKIKESFLDMLPSEAKEVKLEEALQKPMMLQSSKLRGMVGSEAQAVIRAGMAMAPAIAQGEPPRLPKGACTFLAQVYSRLPCFAAVEVKGKDKEDIKMIRGVAAVEHAWKSCQRVGPAEATLKDITLVFFGWWNVCRCYILTSSLFAYSLLHRYICTIFQSIPCVWSGLAGATHLRLPPEP